MYHMIYVVYNAYYLYIAWSFYNIHNDSIKNFK